MTDDLLKYYEKELAYLKQMGAKFSKSHPKIASRLKISNDVVEDPHVSRLIESVAFLNARIQAKLDDDFPELTEDLIQLLYPHYRCPIPSMMISQMEPEFDLDTPYELERHSYLDTESYQGQVCKFRTVYPTTLWPFDITQADLLTRPFIAPGSSLIKNCDAVLKIELKTRVPDLLFSECLDRPVRLYLKGQSQHTYPLYEMLINQSAQIILARGDEDTQPIQITQPSIKAVGFEHDEGLLPYSNLSHIGYRLLSEVFLFPQKFLFIDLTNIHEYITEDISNTLQIYIYLKHSNIELERVVTKDILALSCVPLVNIFEQVAEPIKLEPSRDEYAIIPDIRRPDGLEIYNIEQVKLYQADGQSRLVRPCFDQGMYLGNNTTDELFWHSKRQLNKANNPNEDICQMLITPIGPDYQYYYEKDCVLEIDTLCLNQNEPAKLPFGGGQPKLFCVQASAPIDNISGITAPTPTIRAHLSQNSRWKLLSHLKLNFLSLAGGEDALAMFREILLLYNFQDSSANKSMINSISKLSVEPITLPIKLNNRSVLACGNQIHIEFDERLLVGSSAFLLASVLEIFFSLHSSINSFVTVTATLKGKDGKLKQWAPRSGTQVLI